MEARRPQGTGSDADKRKQWGQVCHSDTASAVAVWTTCPAAARYCQPHLRTATAALDAEVGYQARGAAHRLPPRSAVSQLPATQEHSPCGVNRPLRGRFNIRRHSAKLRQSLRWRFAWWHNPPLRGALRACGTHLMSGAPACLPSPVRARCAWCRAGAARVHQTGCRNSVEQDARQHRLPPRFAAIQAKCKRRLSAVLSRAWRWVMIVSHGCESACF
jgi:hypothetical protein